MGMKIEGDRLVLPPVSARPDGFDLFFQRRSRRKTYQYEIDGEQFSLIVCKDQANTVDPVETEVRDVHTAATKVSIFINNSCFLLTLLYRCCSKGLFGLKLGVRVFPSLGVTRP